MKMQWRLTFAILFALIIAVFAVVNVKTVPVSYLFGVAHFPLILVILGSALIGALSLLLFGIVFQVRVIREKRNLERQLAAANQQLELIEKREAAAAQNAQDEMQTEGAEGEETKRNQPVEAVSSEMNLR